MPASQEVLIPSPEDFADELAEEEPPGFHLVATMPPPAAGAEHLAIQDIWDIPKYVQDRLADAWAVYGQGPADAEHPMVHDWRL